MTRLSPLLGLSLGLAAGLGLGSAAGAGEALSDGVFLELNTVRSEGDTCTLTFQIINGHGSEISRLVYETVLFDSAGSVIRLTLFDFGQLPPGRPRVRQFSVPGMACEGLGRILINGAQSCETDGLDAGACEDGLTLGSRVSTIGLAG